LAELVTVIAISSVLMVLMVTVAVSFFKHNGVNLARQSRTEGVRQVSFWLSDALTHAAPDPTVASAAVLQVAEPQRMSFTAALKPSASGAHMVSRVTLVLNGECWPGGEAEPGVLRRCVQDPFEAADGTFSFCDRGAADCPDELFEDFVVARDVKDEALFGYATKSSAGVADPVAEVTGEAGLAQIVAVEFRVTVGGDPDGPGGDVEATIIKRHSIKGWSRL
jgi:hypothetical protein